LVSPRPIVLTQADTNTAAGDPEPFVLIGTMPAGSVQAADIVDSTSVGRAVLTAANAAAGRTAIGAGVPLVAAAFVAVDPTPADATAVATDLTSVVNALIAAGLMAAS